MDTTTWTALNVSPESKRPQEGSCSKFIKESRLDQQHNCQSALKNHEKSSAGEFGDTYFFLVVPGMEPEALHMPGKWSTTKLQP